MLLAGCLLHFPLFGQHILAERLQQAGLTATAEKYRLFTPTSVRNTADSSFKQQAVIAKMNLDEYELKRLEREQKNFLQISVPIGANQTLELQLISYTVFSSSFKIRNAVGQPLPGSADGRFFHGIIKGDEQSIASASVINGELSGIISTRKGNFNLEKEPTASTYFFYYEQDLKKQANFSCFTQELPSQTSVQDMLHSSEGVMWPAIPWKFISKRIIDFIPMRGLP